MENQISKPWAIKGTTDFQMADVFMIFLAHGLHTRANRLT